MGEMPIMMGYSERERLYPINFLSCHFFTHPRILYHRQERMSGFSQEFG